VAVFVHKIGAIERHSSTSRGRNPIFFCRPVRGSFSLLVSLSGYPVAMSHQEPKPSAPPIFIP
jgi:hypothetical protein